jgi:actin related protein 2/3 complex subunit 5
MANINWRTINIDALDPDSPANFDLSSLTPAVAPVSTADVQNTSQQIRQLLRGGDNEGALQGALENPPYGADAQGKVRSPPTTTQTAPNTTAHHHRGVAIATVTVASGAQ